MTYLTPDDIKVGKWYRAKRYREYGFGSNNDRKVVWISPSRMRVQFDSDTIRVGYHLPCITMEKFLKWVLREITCAELQSYDSQFDKKSPS